MASSSLSSNGKKIAAAAAAASWDVGDIHKKEHKKEDASNEDDN